MYNEHIICMLYNVYYVFIYLVADMRDETLEARDEVREPFVAVCVTVGMGILFWNITCIERGKYYDSTLNIKQKLCILNG